MEWRFLIAMTRQGSLRGPVFVSGRRPPTTHVKALAKRLSI